MEYQRKALSFILHEDLTISKTKGASPLVLRQLVANQLSRHPAAMVVDEAACLSQQLGH